MIGGIGRHHETTTEPIAAPPRPTTKPNWRPRLIRKLILAFFALSLFAATGRAADLVRGVRYKLSAGDLASGIAAVEDYKLTTGVDAEYLDAVGWLARGAEMQGRSEVAKEYV